MKLHVAHSQKSTIGRAQIVPVLARGLSTVVPGLAAAVAEQLFRTPFRPTPPERESAWAETARRTTVESPHGPLAAWVWGESPRSVLLVHGWAGRGLQMGAFAAPLVAAGFRVVAYDAPSHGESPGRRSNLFRHARSVSAVAEAFGPLDGVIAHSLGTAATLLAASRHGLEPGRFVAVGPSGGSRAMTDWFGRLSGFTPPVVDRMRRRLERRFEFVWDDIEPSDLASRLDIDALVIHDRGDREVPIEEGAALARSFASGGLYPTSGLGHRRILRDPEVNAWASWFISKGGAFEVETASDRQAVSPAA